MIFINPKPISDYDSINDIGYRFLPNECVDQWGWVETYGGAATVTYPLYMGTKPWSVSLTVYSPNSDRVSGYKTEAVVQLVSHQSLYIRLNESGASRPTNEAVKVYWRIIGSYV